jgi:hypothetical protein
VERKQSIITAGILSGALLVGSAAYALTSGFLAGGADDGAGTLAPVVATTVPASTAPVANEVGTTSPTAPATLTPGVRHDDDDHVDDGGHRDHDDGEHHGYEGRDDDD